MNFEITLPERGAQYYLRTAGLETTNYFNLWEKVYLYKKLKLPAETSCRYFLAEDRVEVRITVLAYMPETRLKIEVDDGVIGKRIQTRLQTLPEQNEREHKELWGEIKAILKRDGVSYEGWQRGALLPRRAIEALMALCEQTVWFRQQSIHSLFCSHAIAKADRLFVARWLIQLFETVREHESQIGVRIWELASRDIADDLIRLIEEPRHGENRGVLCLALAKTKHPRAAEVIASVLGQEGMTRWALEALGKLKAVEQAGAVRAFLDDPDGDIRREAKKTMKKIGLPIETPPAAVHLVKNRRSLPKGLEEWSSNLDMEDLEPTLQALGKCIEDGFGPKEIAEVVAVAEEMKAEQTKAFCFPISANGKKGELWVVVFMDDEDSPDLAIHANAEVIKKLDATLPERD